ncbi:YiiD C-terminal domain-containing protein [Xanthomonadaceae bacterium JHOS43]|nr:YiiD C-terminal domain-containing protein [Xanthomonadaceae bacterium JHOS43]
MNIPVSPLTIEQRLLSMPPVRALQLRLHDYDGDSLGLIAPLAANINDKGNAFGGSLASVMTLAAWALMSMKLEDAGHVADVYVQDSAVRYLAPLYDDLLADARLVPDQDWNAVIAAFAQRGRARALLSARILARDGTLCCTLEGRFVALTPKPAG